MTREELIKNVALKMDEISSSDDVIVDVNISDNNPLYTQINKLLNESINEALVKAPVHRIGNAMMMNGGPYTEKDTTYVEWESLSTLLSQRLTKMANKWK